mgnify:CR=1 FL=1|jgi:hypothetical protein
MTIKKRLTQREKTSRKQIKKELQEQGLLPPDKPRLNRKKFAKEVLAEFEEMSVCESTLYIHQAIACMAPTDMHTVTAEQVGILKMLKIAIESRKYMESLSAEEKTNYPIEDYWTKVVLPVKNL